MSQAAEDRIMFAHLGLRFARRTAGLLAVAAGWLATGVSASAADTSWHDPILRAVSGDYRQALATRDRLRAELATLPETPRNQQSGRLGFQAYRSGVGPDGVMS